MPISEVQFKAVNGASSGSFNSNVASDSTLFLWQFAYTVTGATISTSSPVFDGQAGAGPVKLIEQQSPGAANAVYGVLWMLPPPGGGWPAAAGPFTVTVTNGIVDANVGMVIGEFSGMGAAAVLDSGAAPNPAVASGASGSPTTGNTGNIIAAPELIVALAVEFGVALTGAGGAWGELQASSFCLSAWQVVTSSGGAYSYNPSGFGGNWAAGVAAVEPATPGVTGAGAVTMAAMTVAGTGAETGSNVTSTGAVTMAAMRVRAAGAPPPAKAGLAVFAAGGAL